jgi:hypothetical protein
MREVSDKGQCSKSMLAAWCRGVVPAKLTAGHYAAVHGNELWVFPGPRNHNMRRVYCLDMLRYRCGFLPLFLHSHQGSYFLNTLSMLYVVGVACPSLHYHLTVQSLSSSVSSVSASELELNHTSERCF